MRGLAMLERGKIGWVEKDIPEIGDMDALIKTDAVAICSSDLHTVKLGTAMNNAYLGHEAIGRIERVGKDVKDFKVGDRVLVPAVTPNWFDIETQRGNSQHSGGLLKGIRFSSQQDGSMAEYFKVIQADMNLALIPEEVSDMSALMIVDMVTTGFYGSELGEVNYGDTVVVIGVGPVGLMAIAGARHKGAGRIIGVGSRPKAIEIAKEYGVSDIVNYREGDIVEQILDLTDGKGADVCIVAGGGNDILTQAVSIVRAGGTVANLNYFDNLEPLPIGTYQWGFGMAHKTIKGGLCPGGRLRMEQIINLVKYGDFDPSKLVTHTFNGIDKLEEAYRLMEKKPKDLIKPVVIF